ncbi:hypothetical protein B0H13DRAFT_2273351 [Mycena leptocephala]|nr:hypothetical protein B0H13DRAFT_2273351 [Mycena leptocephala]
MLLRIAEFPHDVLLELTQRLDVADLLSFLSICRVIRELQSAKTLWLDALTRIREVEMQPLPLSTGDVLEALSLPELQNVVRKVDRLMKNFKSDKPRPVRIDNFSVERSARIFCIPGANLVVAYTNTGNVSCWDTLTSQRVAHLKNQREWYYLQPRAVCTEIKGKALIGAWIQGIDMGNLMRLAVICIDFRDRAHIAISQVISPTNIRHPDINLFINPRVMGFCTTSSVVWWTMNPNDALQTNPNAFLQSSPRDVYNRPRYKDATVQSFPFPPLSASDIEQITSDVHPGPNTISLSRSNTPEVHGPEYALKAFVGRIDGPGVFAPHYGIFAVTSLAGTVRGTEPVNLVHFWPGHADCNSDTIEFGPACVYRHPDHISNTAVGVSGKKNPTWNRTWDWCTSVQLRRRTRHFGNWTSQM